MNRIIRSEAALEAGRSCERPDRRAAARQRLVAGRRRGRAGEELSPLVEITVDASAPVKAEKAANSLAQTVIDVVSTYVDQKIKLLNRQIDVEQDRARGDQRPRRERREATAGHLADKSLSATDKLIAVTGLNNTIGSPSSVVEPSSRSCS